MFKQLLRPNHNYGTTRGAVVSMSRKIENSVSQAREQSKKRNDSRNERTRQRQKVRITLFIEGERIFETRQQWQECGKIFR